MKSLKFIADTTILVSLTATLLMLNAQPSCATIRRADSFKERQASLANASEMGAVNAALQKKQMKQGGYWVQLRRAASVRDYPGGKTIVREGKPVKLEAGQWFHIDPGVGTATWALGYCCVGGGRGCNRHNSVPGFILRAALFPRHATYHVPPVEPSKAASNLIEVSHADGKGNTDFVPAFFHAFPTGAGVIAPQNETRRICAREAWFRNNKLRRIGILRKGDSIIVERYTDGSKNDKRRHWAIGRGVGRGIQPNRSYGHVLAASLCSQ
jgi:hypothetical protein